MTATLEPAAAPPHGWRRLMPYAAPAAVLLAIVVPFLRFHEYSLVLPESLILMGGAALLGAAMGALSRLRQTLGPMLMAIALFAYMFCRQDVTDLLIAAASAIGSVTGHGFAVLAVLGTSLFFATCMICVLVKRHLDTIVIAVFGTMVASTIALPTAVGGEPVVTGALPEHLNSLPPVIHIILDEHIGLAGLPADNEESEKVRQIIPAIYRDFALYSHAYSRFAETKYSLTSLVNRDLGADVTDLLDDGAYTSAPTQNDWFEVLRKKGYAIKVYQTTWFDMCSAFLAVDACYTYSLFSPNAIQGSSLSVGQRLHVLARKLFIGPAALQLEPMVSQAAFARFRSEIAEAPRGVAYIVHLLIPHHGYLYSDDCTLLDPSQWKSYDEESGYTSEERVTLYHSYLAQLVCSGRQMDLLFAELKTLGVYDEATIIVHGDHASRIGERPFVTSAPDALTGQDKIDHYATLLAIKAPGMAAGIRDEPVALQRIFAETLLGGSLGASPPPGEVFIRTVDDDFVPIEFAWPDAPTPVAGPLTNQQVGG